jgi:hypothetical protein
LVLQHYVNLSSAVLDQIHQPTSLQIRSKEPTMCSGFLESSAGYGHRLLVRQSFLKGLSESIIALSEIQVDDRAELLGGPEMGITARFHEFSFLLKTKRPDPHHVRVRPELIKNYACCRRV